MTPERRAVLVKARAYELGFSDCGITDLSAPPHAGALREWLDAGMAGTMTYLHRQAKKRLEPQRILPGARSAIVLTRNYFMPDPPPTPSVGRVAKYARGRDYHEALGEPLAALAVYVESLADGDAVTRTYVDAGPVPERELAQRAGLGWIGKNTMLIHPRAGSFFFIACVLTDVELATDAPFEADRCGTCRRCIDACPTDAFPAERVLDSRRCISYLTIEHRGEVDAELTGLMGDWVFGCDVCQDVCPWNQKFATPAADDVLGLDAGLAFLALGRVESMSAAQFDRELGWTPLERSGLRGMRRNVRVVLANRADEERCPTP